VLASDMLSVEMLWYREDCARLEALAKTRRHVAGPKRDAQNADGAPTSAPSDKASEGHRPRVETCEIEATPLVATGSSDVATGARTTIAALARVVGQGIDSARKTIAARLGGLWSSRR